MLLLLHRRVIFLFVLFFCFEMDEDYNIYEYDSDNDLSGLTQELSQTQGEVYGDKSEDEANGENYRLLLKSAADLANLSGNQTCDFQKSGSLEGGLLNIFDWTFPVAKPGYQLKNQVARGNFQWSAGYRATINT